MKQYQKNAIKSNAIAEICEIIDDKIESMQRDIAQYSEYVKEEMEKPEDERSDWSIKNYTNDIDELSEKIAAMQNIITMLCK